MLFKGLAVLLFSLATSYSFCQVDRALIDSWLSYEHKLDPPSADKIISTRDIDSLSPWLPPGFIDEMKFDSFKMKLQKTKTFKPHISYIEATTKYQQKVILESDGRLTNYVAGSPFSLNKIHEDRRQAGLMVAWNNIHRWQYYGYKVEDLTMAYISAGAKTELLEPKEGLMGGGKLDRLFSQLYHRVYLNNLAMLPEKNYRVALKDSETRFFKDYIEFQSPFNVKGTKFVVERMNDPYADDQVNTYLPTERRVRRFSAKERADSFMGSDATLDDFEGFSGRVLDYKWQYLGAKKIYTVSDMKQETLIVYGPNSRIPDDHWQLRDCHIVEVTSTWSGHPYRSRILFIDKESFSVHLSLIFNSDNLLWKTMQTIHAAPKGNSNNIENSVLSWRGQINIDRLSNRATIVRGRSKTFHPTMKESKIKRVFNVSSLSEGQ